MLRSTNFEDVETLYICSDSQCRNKFNMYLIEICALQHDIGVHLVFKETGHGKGPWMGFELPSNQLLKVLLQINWCSDKNYR